MRLVSVCLLLILFILALAATLLSSTTHLPPLDAAQFSALRSLGVGLPPDPCTSARGILLCDNGHPQRLLALQLEYCPVDAELTTAALAELNTLQALAFLDCPMLPVHVPLNLVRSLTSFSCIASLGKTENQPDAPGLPGTWLSKLHKLTEIIVTDVKVNASGLAVILSGMKHVKQMRFSRTNITGVLPRNTWPPNVTSVDLSQNLIHGIIPSTIRKLKGLHEIDLSNNRLTGRIPDIFAKMKRLQKIALGSNGLRGTIPPSVYRLSSLVYLDLSNNKLNGSIPASLNKLVGLRYLDLSNNDFTGILPFNSTVIKRFSYLRVTGNLGVCYNQTTGRSRFLSGVPACDSSGHPLVPTEISPAPVPTDGFPPAAQYDAYPGESHSGRTKGFVIGILIAVIAAVTFIVLVVLISCWRTRKF